MAVNQEKALYKNKYRIDSARLKNWDYSANGAYYITICVNDRKCFLGNVDDGKMVLSEIGKIVESEWLKSFEIRTELLCDEYCIMPNHIHGIVVIDNTDTNRADTEMNNSVETHGRASLPGAYPPGRASLPTIRTPKSISSFVSGFKASVTKKINELHGTPRLPMWQPRFYDHIIRDENDLNRIRQYIINNPQNWNEDKYNRGKD